MNTLTIDDKQLAVNALCRILKQIDPQGVHTGLTSAKKALDWLNAGHSADVVFLDIEMPEMSGLELAKRIRELCGHSNIIFVTGYSEYALAAHELYVSGFLMKPADEESVRTALNHLRDPLTKAPVASPEHALLTVQCFGNFEVFQNGIPLHFARSKTRELFAYLIDRRGACCTMGELISILWESKPDTISQRSQLRNLIHDLRTTLEEQHAGDVLIRNRNTISVNCGLIDCDYYRFLKHDLQAVNHYQGEYMSQYSWAEMTIPVLK